MVIDAYFCRKTAPDEKGKSRWYQYSENVSIVWCDDEGRAWSAYDDSQDKITREYDSRAELTAALETGVQWL